MIKGPPEFPKKSWRPPWIFSAVSHLYLWSEKSPPENTKAMESAPLNLWRHFLSPPENEKAILMPPWILRRKTERRIHSKTAIFNRPIQGGLAHQKCYARVQPRHSVGGQTLWAAYHVLHVWNNIGIVQQCPQLDIFSAYCKPSLFPRTTSGKSEMDIVHHHKTL